MRYRAALKLVSRALRHLRFPFDVKVDLDLHGMVYADFCNPELVIEDCIFFRPPAQEKVANPVVQCRALHNVHAVDITGRSRTARTQVLEVQVRRWARAKARQDEYGVRG